MPNRYISPASARKLVAHGQSFLPTVPAPRVGRWRRLTDGQLWAAVLGQVAVAGSAGGGERLKANLEKRADQWYSDLQANSRDRGARIHDELVNAGVRFVAEDAPSGRKTMAALSNFNALHEAGGPRAFFADLASKDEPGRIRFIQSKLRYVKHKGSRDLLIGLGAVQHAIALDVRWKNILERVGVRVPRNFQTNRAIYEQLERELLEYVCKPLGVTGAHLDRAFFAKQNYVKIVRC